MIQILIAVVAFVFVVGLLVLIHEGAHFIMAKRCGMIVDTFGIGFGPPIYEKKIKGTLYRVNSIPVGGYVKLLGEEEEFDVEDGFYTKPVFDRIKVVLAGSVANFLLGFLIFCIVGTLIGIPIGKPTKIIISSVIKDSPAEKVGLKPGDVILKINNIKIKEAYQMQKIIHKSIGKKLKLEIDRDNKILIKEVIPQAKIIAGKRVGIIGIQFIPKGEMQRVPPLQSVKWGIESTYFFTTTIIKTLGDMLYKLFFKGIVPKEEVGGPIMIAYFAGKTLQLGAFQFLSFIGILSITLGIINLFPFLALDGGRLVFLLSEAITRRRIDPKKESFLHLIGFAILMFLIICLVYNDLIRLITQKGIIK